MVCYDHGTSIFSKIAAKFEENQITPVKSECVGISSLFPISWRFLKISLADGPTITRNQIFYRQFAGNLPRYLPCHKQAPYRPIPLISNQNPDTLAINV